MKRSLTTLAAVLTAATLAACASTDAKKAETMPPVAQTQSQINQYENLMLNKVWVTVAAVDQNKKQVPANDERVKNYFGFAQYGADGTFRMYTPEKAPKMQGDWSFSEDGKQRHLVAKDASGKVLFERDVENVGLSANQYVYRVYPNAKDRSKFVDIIHQAAQAAPAAQ